MFTFTPNALASTRRRLALMGCAASLAALTACGGGGDDDSPVDKYVGNWYDSCNNLSASSSERYRIEISKTGDKSLHWVAYRQTYASTGCSGTPSGSSVTMTSDDTYNGTKTVDGKKADKFTSREAGSSSPYNYIVYVDNNRMYFGSGDTDAEGYENALETTPSLTR